jgi:hypothetical protein
MATDHESPWKELLEQDAERVLSFFYEDVHADVDWSRDVESLEQEFRKLAPESATGRRVVDKLLKVHQRGTGDPRYLHIEIQSYFEEGFDRRIYVYNSRAEDRYGQPVVSLPILIDDDPEWLPTRYEAELYGTKRLLTFRTTKVLGWRGLEAELEADANPVALFVLAWLEGRRLGQQYEEVGKVKLRLLSRLVELGLTQVEMRHWYSYLDWLLLLPDEYNRPLWKQFQAQGEQSMEFITFAERHGMEKGRREGLHKAIALGMRVRFGPEGAALVSQVEKIEDLGILQAIYDAIEPAQSIDDVRKLLPAAPGEPS